jgi:myo-inositol 2-dehydrogenase/D-chiro-inositol 1-dehydrogenase
MLRTGGLDGVLIASSSDAHLTAITDLAAASMPILCEKPCGLSSRQGQEAAAIAAAAKVPLQVAYWRRFVPGLRKLKSRIDAGELGDLYLVTCYQWDERPPPPSFRTRSGGIFMDMAVHEFDQIRWLSGQEIEALHAVAAQTLSDAPVAGDTESAQVLCALSGGATGLVSLGRRFPLGDVCKMEVFGTRDAEECRFLWPPSADQAFLEALRLQAESFVRWVGGAAAEGASALDAVAALDAAERASRIFQNEGGKH